MIRDVFLSFVRVHILHHAAKGRIFGLEMIDELRRHGYALSPGTLYPILQGLEQSGLLKCEQEVVGGKMRKYYTATAKGRRMLAEVRKKIQELVGELLED
jgi:DNA-binding PadR family transcriptional regulator